MEVKRYNAYEDLILKNGKANLTQLMNWTASNRFITKKHLDELTDLKLLTKKGSYYYLGPKEVEW